MITQDSHFLRHPQTGGRFMNVLLACSVSLTLPLVSNHHSGFTISCWFRPYISMNQPQAYIRPLPLESPSLLPPHPTPLGCHRAPGLSSLHLTANSHWLAVLHMVMCMFQRCSLNLSHPLLPPLCPRIPVLLGQGPQDNLDFLTSVQTWFPGKITSCDAECL